MYILILVRPRLGLPARARALAGSPSPKAGCLRPIGSVYI